MLQKYFREAVDRVTPESNPALNTGESETMKKCASMSSVLGAIKTPRDVVRLFNVFRLRLRDCRGEVSLDELLIFLLLDLVSPETVELIRTHSGLFLAVSSHHPEFSALEREDEVGNLFVRQEELQQAKTKAFEVIPEPVRNTART